MIAEIFLKRLPYYPERLSTVVAREVFHVLKQESLWFLISDDAGDLEEERPLRLVLETRGTPERLLLGDARKREGLAGEAREQNVKVGHVG